MTDEGPLFFTDQGDGQPVIYIHGIGTTSADSQLAGLRPALAPDHRLISVDRPGCGASPVRAGACPPSAQADAIAATARSLGLASAKVVGHSYGTLPALELARRHPDFVEGLVLLAGVYFQDFAALRAFRALPTPPKSLVRRAGPTLTRLVKPVMLRLSFWPDPVPQSFIEGYPLAAVSHPKQVAAQLDDIECIADAVHGLPEAVSACSCPVRLIAGTKDRILSTRRHSLRLSQAAPNALLQLLDGAGHMVHHTHTDVVASAVRAI
ncbi:MAG: alpha/beta hydrolase [Pseudomonadota bacterium]